MVAPSPCRAPGSWAVVPRRTRPPRSAARRPTTTNGPPSATRGGRGPTSCRSFASSRTTSTSRDAWHGRDGPIAIQRAAPDQIRDHQLAALDAALELGVQPVEDHNRPGAVGVGLLPRNIRWGVRMSTALTYLEPARTRPNLTVRADTLVDRVVLRDGRRAACDWPAARPSTPTK